VERSLCIQTPLLKDHNTANLTLLQGAKRLGYACKAIPQNIRGNLEDHVECGARCTVGCRFYAERGGQKRTGKMSGCRVFIEPLLQSRLENDQVDAAKQDHRRLSGIGNFQVDKLVFDDEQTRRRVIGAIGHCTNRDLLHTGLRILILADRTILAAGTLNSPAIMLRSGLSVSTTDSFP
jgi:choline dehydrogenase-like flavoprotein